MIFLRQYREWMFFYRILSYFSMLLADIIPTRHPAQTIQTTISTKTIKNSKLYLLIHGRWTINFEVDALAQPPTHTYHKLIWVCRRPIDLRASTCHTSKNRVYIFNLVGKQFSEALNCNKMRRFKLILFNNPPQYSDSKCKKKTIKRKKHGRKLTKELSKISGTWK